MFLLTSLNQMANDINNLHWTINICVSFVIASVIGSGIAVGVQSWITHNKEQKIMNAVDTATQRVEDLDKALTVLSKCIATSVAGREYSQGISMPWHDSAEAYRIIKEHLDKDSDYLKMLKAQTASDFLHEYGISYGNSNITMGYVGEYQMVLEIDLAQLKHDIISKNDNIESKFKAYNDFEKFRYFWQNE